jgi:hypothetical protein
VPVFDPAVISSFYKAMPYWVFFVLAAAFALAGMLLRHALLARRFRRTNEAGIQMFRSYSHMYVTRMLEQIAVLFFQLLLFCAAVLTVAAILKGIGR